MGAEDPRDPHWVRESAVSVRDMVLDHDRRLDTLDAWRNELRGAFALMKIALGTSIVSAAVSILALAQILGGWR